MSDRQLQLQASVTFSMGDRILQGTVQHIGKHQIMVTVDDDEQLWLTHGQVQDYINPDEMEQPAERARSMSDVVHDMMLLLVEAQQMLDDAQSHVEAGER